MRVRVYDVSKFDNDAVPLVQLVETLDALEGKLAVHAERLTADNRHEHAMSVKLLVELIFPVSYWYRLFVLCMHISVCLPA